MHGLPRSGAASRTIARPPGSAHGPGCYSVDVQCNFECHAEAAARAAARAGIWNRTLLTPNIIRRPQGLRMINCTPRMSGADTRPAPARARRRPQRRAAAGLGLPVPRRACSLAAAAEQ